TWVQDKHPEIHKEIQQFIHSYGDRMIGELKLETKTLRQNPELTYIFLRNYLDVPERNFDHATEQLEQFKNDPHFIKLKKAIERREALRMDRTRLFGMYRTLFLSIGAYLCENGKLADPNYIFYLRLEEIRETLQSGK